MFNARSDDAHIVEAIKRSQGTIEFTLDGKILDANENFLSLMGYSLSEVRGKHHSMFVDEQYAQGLDYKEFWEKLRAGKFFTAEFQRFGKGGKEIWIQATYNPVLNHRGVPYKVFKVATDVTEKKLQAADYAGQIEAIGKSQAVIEFAMDGTILTANRNFLSAMGYDLSEVQGKHHSIFVAPDYAKSPEYADFWTKLRNGQYMAAEYQRFGKGGREVWIQASYNPIMDMAGHPFKVVKYATDITRDKMLAADHQAQVEAISKAQAVISFDMEGTILDANQNFLSVMGYKLDEIRGKHHSMFVERDYAASDEYRQFWETLRAGQYMASDYKRIAKNGNEVWIQASYNPVLDLNGKPFKVVKFANDITPQVKARKVVRELSEGSSESAEAVASASEEMLSAISEISQSMQRSQVAVNNIVEKSTVADQVRVDLEQTSEAMVGVVQIIRDLAEQVNLLALNATIEAARAGDAGKGFAVVAGEVKSLATQTAKATDQISEQIDAMQDITRRVTDSTEQITGAASSVSDYVNAVASAVEEQTAVTKDISKNIQSVFTGIQELTDCVKRIAS
ncbi:PAS domain-containing methyl-accepting chemotaxis protein [Thalassospira sp. MCCC 1A03138]|uniref:methyl-accepting chemotaxis protein n=1 Tax=Thalassospira sp. MCCC 1A03138 TaxID=1470576 RepID=UPI000A1E5131|nr:PAS domain-containing methyl-accepting chemotaxis protein [Thalassospira sp. MCCC 1A03138]OSQ32501.1 histidine kinase [Thalassospira sp. MCCC 1A03138]